MINYHRYAAYKYCQYMIQEYNKYTPADFQVWELLFESQAKLLRNKACSQFIRGIDILQFSEEKIPCFSETNAILLKETGWQIHVVPGLIPAADFFTLLHEKKFCSSTWLRTIEQLGYLEEPDMFHDVFGHVPMLADSHVSRYLKCLAGIALQYISDEEVIELVARLYWFTIEFGLIKDSGGQVKIFGAGILSSPGESIYCLQETHLHKPFDVLTILETTYRKDIYQSTYFVLESLEQLEQSVIELAHFLDTNYSNKRNVLLK